MFFLELNRKRTRTRRLAADVLTLLPAVVTCGLGLIQNIPVVNEQTVQDEQKRQEALRSREAASALL